MGKLIDLTGKQFGNWIVLKKSDSTNKCGHVKWLCQCGCGNIREVSGVLLRNGESKSCGCIHKEIISNNLIGKRFGKLNVIEDTHKRNKKGNIVWKCLCDCGNYVDVSSKHLLNGSVVSCGCSSNPYKDLSNQRFNKLVALEPTEKRSGSAVIWRCKCDCGNICEVSSANLQNGHTKSCGCLSSYGESVIHKILQDNHIKFETQKQFDNCRFPETNTMAKFDFYVNGYLIEYDGDYHFNYSNRQWNTEEYFQRTQQRDDFKNQWCKENDIPLIRIPYTHLNNICLDDLLIETSKFRIV